MKTWQLNLSLAAALVVGATAVPCLSENLHLDAETAARMAVEASTLTVAAADRVEATQSQRGARVRRSDR